MTCGHTQVRAHGQSESVEFGIMVDILYILNPSGVIFYTWRRVRQLALNK